LTALRHTGSILTATHGGPLSEHAELAAVLRCPRCEQGSLSLQRAGWMCSGCSSGYPVLGGIPWLFAEPQSTLAEWRSRLHLLLLELDRESRILRAELMDPVLPPLTRERLERLASAHEQHALGLKGLLEPLGLAGAQTAHETHLALRTRLPGDQGLTNYYVNVHRDWAWGDEENAASLALIQAALPNGFAWGRTLVLGAGASRLAYDIHMTGGPTLTVATDFNPLLLFVARDVTQGRSVELHEFPIAPRGIEEQAVLRTLRAPAAVRPGFEIVAADSLRAPFAPGAFDTVVTPWFIDIIDEDLARFGARVNGLLRDGGSWINFGSLAFAQGMRALRFSLEETVEIVEQAGFMRPQPREASIPYMRSPASRHARMETVLAWCVAKQRAAAAPAGHSTLPEWLVAGDRPVPLLEDFRMQAVSTRIHAFLMSLVDGKRSVKDMAQVIVEQRLMAPADAESAVRAFLARMYEDSRRRASF
jgi:hypothetical protein